MHIQDFKANLKHIALPGLGAACLLTACLDQERNLSAPSETKAAAATSSSLPRLGALKGDPNAPGLKKVSAIAMGNLPAKVDLSPWMPPIGDQGAQNSCAAWAVMYAAKSMVEKRDRGWDHTLPQHQFSPAWSYNLWKAGSDCNALSSVTAHLEMLRTSGADNLADFPVTSNCNRLPDAASWARSEKFMIHDHYRLMTPTVNDIKTLLAAKKPVIIAIEVFPDLDNLNAANPIYDNLAGATRGFHAVTVVGYDDAKQAFRFANSWGVNKGIAGYFWLAYSLISNPALAFEAYYFENLPLNEFDHSFYKWNGSKWEQAANGGGVQIATTSAGVPWIINKNNEIWRKKDGSLGSSFDKLSGLATDIGTGADASVWIIGTDAIPGSMDHSIYKWNGSGWVKAVNGGAKRIAVFPNGQPWVVNAAGQIWRRSSADPLDGNFIPVPGFAVDIGIGKNGAIWMVGNEAIPDQADYKVYKWNGADWVKASDIGGVRISVDPNGVPYVINSKGEIRKKLDSSVGSGWTKLSGLGTDVGIGSNGAVWITGTNNL